MTPAREEAKLNPMQSCDHLDSPYRKLLEERDQLVILLSRCEEALDLVAWKWKQTTSFGSETLHCSFCDSDRLSKHTEDCIRSDLAKKEKNGTV